MVFDNIDNIINSQIEYSEEQEKVEEKDITTKSDSVDKTNVLKPQENLMEEL
jgi:hypothetical protein